MATKKQLKKYERVLLQKKVDKFKDINKIIFIFEIFFLVLFVLSVFVKVFQMEASFMYTNPQDIANATGSLTSFIPYKENVRNFNFIFGIASETIGYNYFDKIMLIIFCLQLLFVVLLVVPFSNKKVSIYRYFAVALGFIAITIVYTNVLHDLRLILENICKEMIDQGGYLASSTYSVSISAFPYLIIAFSFVCSGLAIYQGSTNLYMEKKNELLKKTY